MKRVLLSSLLLACLAATAPAATLQETVADLATRIADPQVENRFAPQIELQTLAAKAGRPGAEAERAELAALLAAKAADAATPQPARVWIVRQLEHLGGAEVVASLTGLLASPDAELRETARRALEKNPAPEAGARLRAALQQSTDTRWTIGLVNSLAQRSDTAAVALITPLLAKTDTAEAAAAALGKIADDASVEALWQAFAKDGPGAAIGLVSAARKLELTGAGAKAAPIYARLITSTKVTALRAAALTGLARTAAQAPAALVNLTALIQEAVTGKDVRLQMAGVEAAVISGKTGTLALMLGNLPVTAKARTVRVLDASSEAIVAGLAADADESVRIAALETLGAIGSAPSVPVLLKAAAGDTAPEKTAALASLARVNGAGAPAAIAQAAAQGEPKLRAAAIAAIAARGDSAAIPALLTYAADKDSTVAKAASSAVGKIGGDDQIEALAKLVLGGKAPGADTALQAIASRSKDKSAAARTVIDMAAKATGQELASILDVLSLLGGDDALKAVLKHTASPDADVKDAAIRALCNWPDFAACKPLTDMAAAPGVAQKYQVLALQAAGRIIRGAEAETPQVRVDASLEILKAASRDQEKKLALGVLASIKDPKAAAALIPFLQDEKLKSDAAQAALSIADSLRRNDRRTATKLAEAVKAAAISEALTKRADELLARIAARR